MAQPRHLLVPTLVLAAAFLASWSLAQGTWFETGTLTTVIGGEERQLHTYGTLVPEDVAEGVTDPQQLAFLERIAGTEQHTATHKFFDGVTMGGMVLTPDTIWVALTFRYGGHDASGPYNVTLQIPLDPATLEVSDPDQVEITYFPNGSSYDDFYALTEGGLTLQAAEVVDDVTLRLVGSFSGLMTHQTGYDIVHDPASATEAYGEFVVERVVGSQLVLEMLGAE